MLCIFVPMFTIIGLIAGISGVVSYSQVHKSQMQILSEKRDMQISNRSKTLEQARLNVFL